MRGVGGEGEERYLAVGRGDAFGVVLVNPFEVGSKDGVLCDKDGARVGGIAVVPVGEAVVVVGCGGEYGGVVGPVVAAAGHSSVYRHVGLGGEAEGDAVGEVGGEVGVLREEDGAGVLGVAVVPAAEAVTGFGRGGDDNVGEVGEAATAIDGTQRGIAAFDGKVVEVGYSEERTPSPVCHPGGNINSRI